MRFVDADGRLILDWSRPPADHPTWAGIRAIGSTSPSSKMSLIDGLRRWPHVAIRNRCEVFALDEIEHGVRVRYEDLSSGKLTDTSAALWSAATAPARWCAASSVRGWRTSAFTSAGSCIDVLLKRDAARSRRPQHSVLRSAPPRDLYPGYRQSPALGNHRACPTRTPSASRSRRRSGSCWRTGSRPTTRRSNAPPSTRSIPSSPSSGAVAAF